MEPVPRIVPIYQNRRLQRPFWNLSFEKMLGRVAELGFDCVETGAYPGSVHRKVEKLLTSKGAARDFLKQVQDAGLFCALSCHGNPIHPNMQIARAHQTAALH
jgi:sugar phosphate isomerase/epimerase